ncbi:hypothetical protein GLW05_18515 [Pontibacillus yanchengensis]|uniref:Uncharacterized protein n=1 Tax=Pontibacillus yanchengensis TaxID=462910 RepID=A0A6I5A5F2_9BACI|nr:hypothetical protein [Pontibacillus yanchengensis]MYL35574.1 hypothetical protein [Pontibacillus yanchengensis]
MEEEKDLYKKENGDYLSYDMSVVNKYITMEEFSSKLRKIKIIFIVIATFVIFSRGLFDIYLIDGSEYQDMPLFLIAIIALPINYFISYFLHKNAYQSVSKNKIYSFKFKELLFEPIS